MSPRLIGCLKGSFALWQVSHFRSARPPRSTGCWMGIDCGVGAGRAEYVNNRWQILHTLRITLPVFLIDLRQRERITHRIPGMRREIYRAENVLNTNHKFPSSGYLFTRTTSTEQFARLETAE